MQKIEKGNDVMQRCMQNTFCNLHFRCKLATRSVGDSFFAFRSASAERNENHKNQPLAPNGAAGRNAQGRWGRSAALGLKPRHGVSDPKQKSISSNSNLQISNPPQISPQRPCAFRPAAPNRPSTWFFVIFISLGIRRAKCKMIVLDGS